MGDLRKLDPDRSDWPRRLPHYLYLSDLVEGRRVLEVGCKAGFGARFLASRGAASVIGVDVDPRSIENARARHRLTNLEFRREEPGALEIEDQSFDCVFVPDGVDLMRRPVVLSELRRVLARDGRLILCARSADRPAAEHGASYHECLERLGELFPPVRIFAQAPLCAMSLVEYGDEEAPEPELALDTTLLGLAGDEDEVTEYVAVCGGPEGAALRGMTVVQIPQDGGLEAICRALGREPEQIDPTQVDEAWEEGARTVPGHWAEASVRTIEPQAGGADEEALRRQLELALEGRRRAEAEREVLRRELLEIRSESERARSEPSGPSPSEQVSRALAAHEQAMRSLEETLDERQAYAEELEDELERSRVAVRRAQERTGAAEQRITILEEQLTEFRRRAAVAEGELLRAAGGSSADSPADELQDRRPARPGGPEADLGQRLRALADRVVSLENALASERQLLGEVERGLADVGRDVSESATAEAPSAWAAQREEKLRQPAGELGKKDAEITLLHVGVSSLRDRVREVVEEVKRARERMSGLSAPEMLEMLDRLTERLSAYQG